MVFELQCSNIDSALYDLYCDQLRGCPHGNRFIQFSKHRGIVVPKIKITR